MIVKWHIILDEKVIVMLEIDNLFYKYVSMEYSIGKDQAMYCLGFDLWSKFTHGK